MNKLIVVVCSVMFVASASLAATYKGTLNNGKLTCAMTHKVFTIDSSNTKGTELTASQWNHKMVEVVGTLNTKTNTINVESYKVLAQADVAKEVKETEKAMTKETQGTEKAMKKEARETEKTMKKEAKEAQKAVKKEAKVAKKAMKKEMKEAEKTTQVAPQTETTTEAQPSTETK